MSESIQKKLDRVRQRRLPRITYEVETERETAERELPFVVGVIGDFSGNPTSPLRPLKHRNFVTIDRDSFDHVMNRLNAGLNLRVKNTLRDDGSEMLVQLQFNSMDDFSPARVANQVEPLRDLLEKRNRLRDLLATTDRSEDLKAVLERVWKNTEDMKELSQKSASTPCAMNGTLDEVIAAMDAMVSRQLSAILHHPDFQRLEGSWRGLRYLVFHTETSATLKVRFLDCKKSELVKDRDRAAEFDQSQIFRKVHDNELGMPGGEPFGALIGDFELENLDEDLDLLGTMSKVAAASFCPFLSAASPKLFKFDDWTETSKPRDLEAIVDPVEYTKWKSYRASEDSRFVALTIPRTLARLPYSSAPGTQKIEEFSFEEIEGVGSGKAQVIAHDHFCWMNSAYVLGMRLTLAFVEQGVGSCAPITRGSTKVASEVYVSDELERQVSDLGFISFYHCPDAPVSAFYSGLSLPKPKSIDQASISQNTKILSSLDQVFCAARFALYIKVMARDSIYLGSDPAAIEGQLQQWIVRYVSADPAGQRSEEARSRLREASIAVRAITDEFGVYECTMQFVPHCEPDEPAVPIRLKTQIRI